MFDPTAFDNMKVVIEGALYDKDISGEIVITDRNDFLNMAKMSRLFEVMFRLPNSSVEAQFKMESRLDNLAAELLPSFQAEQLAGCYVKLSFFLQHERKIDYQLAKNILVDIWGPTRIITVSVVNHPLDLQNKISTVLKVKFDRMITEDQLEDLVEMTEFMITTLMKLSEKL
ncbi:hypothetical protein QNH20_16920 [Neobacillus sp. WH10]|uniref:hypothetical protein n=1 Tax=Neobacillus sp. WH10 TaxID=3047873 RepID=UPI0024C1AD19|nr:hypothetical protein [Neobacillus sp. WH10]WHY75799.1 hypothetical protein QNH20_16920 [Neobacillus sp. WH10]